MCPPRSPTEGPPESGLDENATKPGAEAGSEAKGAAATAPMPASLVSTLPRDEREHMGNDDLGALGNNAGDGPSSDAAVGDAARGTGEEVGATVGAISVGGEGGDVVGVEAEVLAAPAVAEAAAVLDAATERNAAIGVAATSAATIAMAAVGSEPSGNAAVVAVVVPPVNTANSTDREEEEEEEGSMKKSDDDHDNDLVHDHDNGHNLKEASLLAESQEAAAAASGETSPEATVVGLGGVSAPAAVMLASAVGVTPPSTESAVTVNAEEETATRGGEGEQEGVLRESDGGKAGSHSSVETGGGEGVAGPPSPVSDGEAPTVSMRCKLFLLFFNRCLTAFFS